MILFGGREEVGVYLQPLNDGAISSLTVMRMGYTARNGLAN
ncbi:hypothetical protein [Gramella sp. MAR_2010_147]|nr:hypothetical protein [Gramella sp. MAR_2010_147]SDR72330.1 hypothetical protein SAMN04488553_0441 [Gramella sp. MAR_2010_147]